MVIPPDRDEQTVTSLHVSLPPSDLGDLRVLDEIYTITVHMGVVMVITAIPMKIVGGVVLRNHHQVLGASHEAVDVIVGILVQHRARTSAAKPMVDLVEVSINDPRAVHHA